MQKAQTDLFEEIFVDNFAGGGGASTGIELATGHPVAIAINHDPAAILMHKSNHPHTEHIQASVWDVDPVEVCRGRPVGLAWFSPDCKHFSKAKGSALVDRNIRGLAWIVLRWAGTVRPRVIILENVEEFQTWGPVRKGKPIKSKSGTTFHTWLSQLQALGYRVEHRELVAADYGAPTTRKRFVLVARCDGQPIVWPERTHAPKDSEEVRSGKLLPWRSAAEIIDWSLPMYSIFATKEEIKAKYGVNVVRPLAENTQRRAIRGVDKFTIKSGNPFLIPVGYGERAGQAPRVHDINAPVPTVVSTGKLHLVEPVIAPITFSNTGGSTGSPTDQPVGTIRTAGGQILAAANLVQCNHAGGDRVQKPEDPVPTISSHHAFGLAAANLIQYHTEQTENVRANDLTAPLPTADASNRYGLISAQLTEYYGNGNPLDVREPMHTVTAHDREALTAAHIVEFKGQDIGQSVDKPLRTVTACAGLKRACGGGEFAVAGTVIRKYIPGTDVGHWTEVRALLNKHCGYELAEDEILLLQIGWAWWYISDITMRMLTPRELYAAMGFPPDYIIDRDYTGKPYPKTQQVARCGNAVCPPMATAVVRANLPEYRADLRTMEELESVVAV